MVDDRRVTGSRRRSRLARWTSARWISARWTSARWISARWTSAKGGALRCLGLGFVGLLLAGGAAAQSEGLRIPNIVFSRLAPQQQLSQGTVMCALQDHLGFVWIGTQSGLNRFDGHSFEVFSHDPEDPGSLPHEWVQVLYEDPAGDLWVGTQGGGLGRWMQQEDRFQTYRNDPADPHSLPGDRVRTLSPDGTGKIWVGTFESGLALFEPTTGKFDTLRHDPENPDSLGDDRIRSVYRDRRGRVWIGTLGGLDRLRDDGTFEHFRSRPDDPTTLSDDRVRTLLEDDSGMLWVGTFRGLNRLDPTTGIFTRILADTDGSLGLSHNRIRAQFRDAEGRLWVGTDAGLNLWDSASEHFFTYRHQPSDPSSLGSDQITAILQDEGGVLWFGTLGAGLSTWDPMNWNFNHLRVDSTSTGGPRNNVFAFAGTESGVWVGTLGGGLSRVELGPADRKIPAYSVEPIDIELQDPRITSLLEDRTGQLWVGTLGGGLGRLTPESGTYVTHRHDPEDPASLSGDAITTLFEDRAGHIWVGTHGTGLNRLDRERGTFERFQNVADDPTSLVNDRVFSIAEDSRGDLWIATDGGGLSHFDGERFQAYRHDPGDPTSLSGDNTTVVHIDDDERLFVGTLGRGLVRLVRIDGASGRAEFERITSRDGLAADTIWGIEHDDMGCLWISTSRGLTRYDPARRTFKNYDTSHGLQSTEFNLGAHHRSPNGELFFGGINGFNAFFPESVEENTHLPPVVLTSFSKLNEEVRFDRPLSEIRTIELDHRDDVVSFEVAALDFSAPHKNRYRHILEGFNDDWIDKGNNRRIDYTNLDPGEYTLWVQAANNDGLWNTEGLRLELIITPPFWQTWWFRLVALGAFGSAVLLVYKLRTRTIRRNNERLTQLVRERTLDLEAAQEKLLRQERLAVLGELAGSVAHEIRNPLGVIRNSTYFLRLTQKERIDGVGQEHLELIEREIQQTNRIIGELLDYARDRPAETRPAVLQDLVTRALEMVERPPEIELHRRRWDQELEVQVDHDQIERLLANLIQNAYQAMPEGGELEVECLRHGESRVRVRVRDTGSGIDLGDQDKVFEPLFTTKANGIGLGLALSQRYARLNGGHIEFESSPGEGTEFRLELPMAGENGTPGTGADDGAGGLGLESVRAGAGKG